MKVLYTGKEKEFSVRMLTENRIPGLIPCEIHYMDGESWLYFDISNLQSLSNLFLKKQMPQPDFIQLIACWKKAQEQLNEYFLRKTLLCLRPEMVFRDLENGQFLFAALPESFAEETQDSAGILLDHLVTVISHEDREYVKLVYQLHEEVHQNRISLEKYLSPAVTQEAEWMGQGAPGQVAPEQGAPEQGAPGQGVSGQNAQEAEWMGQVAPEYGVVQETQAYEYTRTETEHEKYREAGNEKYRGAGNEKHRGTGRACAQEPDRPEKGIDNKRLSSESKRSMGFAVKMGFAASAIVYLAGYLICRKNDLSYSAPALTVLSLTVGLLTVLIHRGQKKMDEKESLVYQEQNQGELFFPDGAMKQGTDNLMEGGENDSPENYEMHRPVPGQGKTVFLDYTEKQERKLYGTGKYKRCRIPMEHFPFTIGKSEEYTDYRLTDNTVSRIHVRFFLEGDTVWMMDLNSTNGTFHNGIRLSPNQRMELEAEDEIGIGRMEFVYR